LQLACLPPLPLPTSTSQSTSSTTSPPSSINIFYKRFIDNGFAIWLHDLNPTINTTNWNDFKALINVMGLCWTVKSPRKKLIFMDMTIQVEGEKIVTTIYAKPLALYQYIPPNSCHPPGVLTSLIFGQILRIYQLCSHSKDIDRELSLLHTRDTHPTS
jgi:hypothetical protein